MKIYIKSKPKEVLTEERLDRLDEPVIIEITSKKELLSLYHRYNFSALSFYNSLKDHSDISREYDPEKVERIDHSIWEQIAKMIQKLGIDTNLRSR